LQQQVDIVRRAVRVVKQTDIYVPNALPSSRSASWHDIAVSAEVAVQNFGTVKHEADALADARD